MNKNLKIFSELYLGVAQGSLEITDYENRIIQIKNEPGDSDEANLGFATPYETTSAGKKRQETVNSWLSQKQERAISGLVQDSPFRPVDWEERAKVVREFRAKNQTLFPTSIIKNEPLEGFTITSDVRRVYWGGGNVVFRVEDPRGFELEIQSQNLMALIKSTNFINGKIEGKCVWARDGATNVLLHESSEEYKNAYKAAETLKRKSLISKSKLVVGGVYFASNGEKAVYLGEYTAFGRNYLNDYSFSARYDNSFFNITANTHKQVAVKIGFNVVPTEHTLLGTLPTICYLNSPSSFSMHKSSPLVEFTGEVLSSEELQKLLDGIDSDNSTPSTKNWAITTLTKTKSDKAFVTHRNVSIENVGNLFLMKQKYSTLNYLLSRAIPTINLINDERGIQSANASITSIMLKHLSDSNIGFSIDDKTYFGTGVVVNQDDNDKIGEYFDPRGSSQVNQSVCQCVVTPYIIEEDRIFRLNTNKAFTSRTLPPYLHYARSENKQNLSFFNMPNLIDVTLFRDEAASSVCMVEELIPQLIQHFLDNLENWLAANVNIELFHIDVNTDSGDNLLCKKF